MKLDKRIKEGKRPLDCFDTDVAKQFIGKKGLFGTYDSQFANLDRCPKCLVDELKSVDDYDDYPFIKAFYGSEPVLLNLVNKKEINIESEDDIRIKDNYVIVNGKNLSFKVFSFGSNYSTKLVAEEEFEIKDLDIDSSVGDVLIETKDTEKVKVEIYSDRVKEYKLESKDDKIIVKFDEKNSGFSFFSKSSVIKIYVPTGYDKNIKAVMNVGDLKSRNLRSYPHIHRDYNYY